MDERVQLLDVLVDIAPTKEASRLTLQYLEEEGSRVVYFINSETYLSIQSNKDVKDMINHCEQVLPANANISSSIDQVLGYRRDSFFIDSYLDIIFNYVIEKGYEILLVTDSETDFISVQENLHAKYPYLTLSGVYMTETEGALDHIVNEINSVAPEVLLVALPEKRQHALLEGYRNQMNAQLMIFSGNVLYHRAVSELEVPKTIRKLRFDNVYKWFRLSGKLRTVWANIALKHRMRYQKKKEKR